MNLNKIKLFLKNRIIELINKIKKKFFFIYLLISCRKCRHEFCWICMQDWTLHSTNTGGFFQCNRYDPTAAAAASSTDLAGNATAAYDDDNDDDDDDASLRLGAAASNAMIGHNAGSAQAGNIRMKLRGRKMQRFIHH